MAKLGEVAKGGNLIVNKAAKMSQAMWLPPVHAHPLPKAQ